MRPTASRDDRQESPSTNHSLALRLGLGLGVGALVLGLVWLVWWRYRAASSQGLSSSAINAEMTQRILANPRLSPTVRQLLE